MIHELGFTFIVLPCIGAVAIAAALRDWRLAAAAAFGLLGVLFISSTIPEAVRLFIIPIVFGAMIGAAITTLRLVLRPSADVWSRMIWALLVTTAAGFIVLSPFMIGT